MKNKKIPNTIEKAFIYSLFDKDYSDPSSENYIQDPDFFNIFRVYIGLQPLALDNRTQKAERKRRKEAEQNL